VGQTRDKRPTCDHNWLMNPFWTGTACLIGGLICNLELWMVAVGRHVYNSIGIRRIDTVLYLNKKRDTSYIITSMVVLLGEDGWYRNDHTANQDYC
jgi:hypothetical protein